MTHGQAFVALVVAASGAVAALVGAQARWPRHGLGASAAALALASCAFFVLRAGGPSAPAGRLLASIAIPLAAVAAGAGVVYLRRGSRSRLWTGALAWGAVLFAFFESAYLLRP